MGSELTGPSASLVAGGSPKSLYTYFLLGLCKSYFETLSLPNPTPYQIDNSTAALISFCPNAKKREELWDTYVKEKEENRVGASVKSVGNLVSYLAETLELEEEAVGGLF